MVCYINSGIKYGIELQKCKWKYCQIIGTTPLILDSFTPLVLTIPEPLDLDKISLRIKYPDSNIKLWTKNVSDETRTSDSVIKSGQYSGDILKGLLGGNGSRTATFWIEGLKPSACEIKFDVDPDGPKKGKEENPAKYVHSDVVMVTPVKVDIAMDGNRDGNIDFKKQADKKYLFWVNDDHDELHYNTPESMWQEDDLDGGKDCDDDYIGHKEYLGEGCKRDLEDLTRLHVGVPDSISKLDDVTYYLKFENGDLEANIFEAVKRDNDSITGNLDYLKVAQVAENQITKKRLITINSGEAKLDGQYISKEGKRSCFLLEGKKAGKGNLIFIVKKGGHEIARGSVELELREIDEFYEKFNAMLNGSVNEVSGDYGQPEKDSYTYKPEKNDYLLYVHGWNMAEWEKARWAETVFKRMWWQKYKGHIGIFSWPTLTANWTGMPGRLNYDNSEQRSWNSAIALKKLLADLNSKHPGKVRVIAHSMGNVVTGEAARISSGQVIHTYFATQAALSANCYDNSSKIDNPAFTAYTTPNIYGFYTSGKKQDKPYLKQAITHIKKRVRLYNEKDWALKWWDDNNETKPDFEYNYWGDKNSYTQSNDPNKKDVFYIAHIYPLPHEILLFPPDRFEIFSFCLESRSRALGALTKKIAGFENEVNLGIYKYDNKHYSHSRQFRSNIVDENAYWREIFKEGGF